MSSGSSDDSTTANYQLATMQNVPQASFNPGAANNAGRTYVPQTYTAQGKPSWMTGAWDMPTWGKSAATGENLTQPTTQPRLYIPENTASTNNANKDSGFSLLSFTEPNKKLGDDGTQWTGDKFSTGNFGRNWASAKTGKDMSKLGTA